MSEGAGLRIGHGVDAHRLVADRRLWLGGVLVPHDRGLEGHSDGDVVCHALADAILGAAGQGDLGRHFPSSDERWAGAPSLRFVAEAARLARAAGFQVQSAHVVAVAAEPRLAPHLDAMRAALAQAAGVAPECLAVGATSTDGMGFTGRGEGIAASAVALLAPID